MKKNQSLFLIIGAIVIAGLSFFAGTRYQLSQASSSAQGFGNGQGQRIVQGNSQGSGQGNGQQQNNGKSGQNGFQGGMISGEIASQDGQSLTIKMADGSTKIVIVAESTTYKKSTDASASDLKIGESIMVSGTSNTDGSVTAKTVTIGQPMFLGQDRLDNAPTTNNANR